MRDCPQSVASFGTYSSHGENSCGDFDPVTIVDLSIHGMQGHPGAQDRTVEGTTPAFLSVCIQNKKT